ncbi:hypothetical protein NQ317_013151 [Molorchus minor]|uniref:Uncharacterized protein n=1 Tax=Molorchus minor TaxID=1323400 RepID=A0ABQ9IQG6_9CUCU|nr:hypothetical protein NQ317_013151 [Molorchus minor]
MSEYLKGTALYFAASFLAPLKFYNFGTLKFIGFLADTETILDTLDLCKGVKKLPCAFKNVDGFF